MHVYSNPYLNLALVRTGIWTEPKAKRRHFFHAGAAKYVRYNHRVRTGSQDEVVSLDFLAEFLVNLASFHPSNYGMLQQQLRSESQKLPNTDLFPNNFLFTLYTWVVIQYYCKTKCALNSTKIASSSTVERYSMCSANMCPMPPEQPDLQPPPPIFPTEVGRVTWIFSLP